MPRADMKAACCPSWSVVSPYGNACAAQAPHRHQRIAVAGEVIQRREDIALSAIDVGRRMEANLVTGGDEVLISCQPMPHGPSTPAMPEAA
jgi:hypothetical protein